MGMKARMTWVKITTEHHRLFAARRKVFAVVYRWKLNPGSEESFARGWAAITDEFIAEHGGLGSCLHRGEDGLWLAYARWPDRATWERDKDVINQTAMAEMSAAVVERFPPIPLEVATDKLV